MQHPWIQKLAALPSPMAGLALGIASLGWCWESMSSQLDSQAQIICAIIAAIMLLLLSIKFMIHPKVLRNELSHPVVGSVIPTYAMAIMVVSKAIGIYSVQFGLALWLAAIAIHLVFLGAFVYYRAIDFNLDHMVPSWFVPPIGIVVAAVTFPGQGFDLLAQVIVIFGMLCYLLILPIMLYRLIFGAPIADAAKPSIAILAAPASLSLAGYLTITSHPSIAIVSLLVSIALLMTGVIYLAFFHLMKLPFSPAYAAFTFPMVIGATALFKTAAWLATFSLTANLSHTVHTLAVIELFIATAVVGYVALRYILHYLPFRHRAA
ncbi:TDT family transporter [Shewanella sp. NIFS-20-20]|uniref:TDT family transporter n=1 Tax=Shewanella sp. NIFS-20-20 TaxID=2853806 RepID=UPI001C47524E|nr:TDT family transporter [Shewanella sp. NIFS-20-20]MBV7315548.1 TDT family transporter [Shewanella sp. NIFS-20-20]